MLDMDYRIGEKQGMRKSNLIIPQMISQVDGFANLLSQTSSCKDFPVH